MFFHFWPFFPCRKATKWPKIPFQYPLALRHPKILEKYRKHHSILVSVRNRFWPPPPAKADIATAILTNVIEHLVLLLPPISTPSPPKRCGRILLEPHIDNISPFRVYPKTIVTRTCSILPPSLKTKKRSSIFHIQKIAKQKKHVQRCKDRPKTIDTIHLYGTLYWHWLSPSRIVATHVAQENGASTSERYRLNNFRQNCTLHMPYAHLLWHNVGKLLPTKKLKNMSANCFPIFSFPTVQYASTEVFVFTCNSRPNVTHYIHNKIPELMKLVPSKFKIYNFSELGENSSNVLNGFCCLQTPCTLPCTCKMLAKKTNRKRKVPFVNMLRAPKKSCPPKRNHIYIYIIYISLSLDTQRQTDCSGWTSVCLLLHFLLWLVHFCPISSLKFAIPFTVIIWLF